MFIKVEPADFFMYQVQLFFDLEHPDSEDQAVRDYLTEHELEPKYRATGEFEGRQCEVMQYGGCYLGKNLEHLAQIQRRAVQVELLTAEIQRHLDAPAGDGLPLPGPQRQAAIAALVQQFHQDSSFKSGENGELIASLNGGAVREAARRLLTSVPAS